MAKTRQLDTQEMRILGVLLEKEQTTPDYYPLTLSALVAACNQKTNRHPVMDLSQSEVSDALERLREDVLVWRTEGARAVRWQHSLDRRWELENDSKAIMTLLLLRGPQTPGELRTRGERMHGFASVDEVEACLKRMSEGFDALVRELPRAPGQREARWTHLVAQEGHQPEAALAAPAAPHRTAPAPPSAFEQRLSSLEETVAALQEEIRELKEQLGESS